MTEATDLRLNFTVNTLCIAEKSLGKSLSVIFDEVQSEEGAELRTLRALVAAGRVHLSPAYAMTQMPGLSNVLQHYYDEIAAGKLIDKHGIGVVASQVGKALGTFVQKLAANKNV